MHILFDENIRNPLKRALRPHLVERAKDRGWAMLKNGLLLSAAEQSGFELVITADQNIRYQQNLASRRIALLVLGSNRWKLLKKYVPQILEAVEQSHPNSFVFVEIPLPPKPHRNF